MEFNRIYTSSGGGAENSGASRDECSLNWEIFKVTTNSNVKRVSDNQAYPQYKDFCFKVGTTCRACGDVRVV